MNPRKLISHVFIALCVLPLTGCYALTVPVYTSLCSEGADREVLKLEKREKYLLARYKKKTNTIKTTITRQKREITRSLKKRDLSKALVQIDSLYKFSHPCGPNECKKDHPSYGKDYIIREEDINRERDFVIKSSDQAYKLALNLLKTKQYSKAEANLKGVASLVSYDKSRRAKFIKTRDNIKRTWLKMLDQQIGQLKGPYPGAALLYMARARALAKDLKDQKKIGQYTNQINTIRQNLITKYRYVYTIDRTQGELAGSVQSSVRRAKWLQAIAFQGSNTNRVDGVVRFTMGSPSHSRSMGSTTGRFKYISGTKQVPNPARNGIEKEINRRTSLKAHYTDECRKWRKRKAAGQTSHVNSDQCRYMKYEGKEIANLQKKLNALPRTLSKDVYSEQSYPIKIHKLNSRASFSASVTSTKGLPLQSTSAGISSIKTDEEHGAHSRRGGGVQADPASPPSISSGNSGLQSAAVVRVKNLIVSGFTTKRNLLLNVSKSNSNKRLDALITYYLLDRRKMPNALNAEIGRLSGLDNHVNYLKDL